jgi:hypothetical protein
MIENGSLMKVLNRLRRWFRLGNAGTPAGRALLIEQFRILTSQIPVLMAC